MSDGASSRAPAIKRIKGFDGIRGVASVLVVVHHSAISWRHLGHLSVFLFFALSGFLIFGILRSARARVDCGHSTWHSELKHFWANRAIRIFPVYYIVLAILLAVSGAAGMFRDLRDQWLWYATYLQNFEVARIGTWGQFTHTWSLAVEQQFYVLFGMLFLLVPVSFYRWLFPGLAGLCIFAIVALHPYLSPVTEYTLPFLGFLYILAGGAMALFGGQWSILRAPTKWQAEIIAFTLGAILFLCAYMPAAADTALWSKWLPVPYVIVIAALSVVAALFLYIIASFQELWLVRLLERPFLRWLGTVSYALYVVHYPITHVAARFESKIGHMGVFAITLGVSLALSELLRLFVELPAQRLKYRMVRKVPMPESAAVAM